MANSAGWFDKYVTVQNRDLQDIVLQCQDIAEVSGHTMTPTGAVSSKLELICTYAQRMAESYDGK